MPMNKVRILLVASVVAVIASPIIAMSGAFTPDALLFGLALLIMGSLGLYAGMKALPPDSQN